MNRLGTRPLPALSPARDGPRPVNLRHDLAAIADLIEQSFAQSMDRSSRSALRELRALSKLGIGMHLLARLNEMALGMGMGTVYTVQGKIVGNVSVYPANYPRQLGDTRLLANVAVHPKYRERGIAAELLRYCLRDLRRRGVLRVILQVDYDNAPALRLYERVGMRYERAWCTWRRSSNAPPPPAAGHAPAEKLRHRRAHEWQAEYALAQAARPNSRGGLGWLKPIHPAAFHHPIWRRALLLLSLRSREVFVLPSADTGELKAVCRLNSSAGRAVHARLFASPSADQHRCAAALLAHLCVRHPHSTIHIEHPRDEVGFSDIFAQHHFTLQRELWHMCMEL